MPALKSILLMLLAGYLGLIAVMYLAQRALMYFPEKVRTAPAAAGFAQAQEIELAAPDGEHLVAWHVPPRGEGRPVFVYFHGNGGALRHRVERFAALVENGSGLVALSWRGYGGSSGSPSEEGLIADGRAAYDFAASHYAPAQIALWGESLGTGVAIAVAAEKKIGALILEAPFTATVDIAAAIYPFIPVRWLMKDQFRSDLRIGKVTAPILIMHGARDTVVPIRFGEKLFAMAPEPKSFVRFAKGGHEDLTDHGAVEAAQEFLARVMPEGIVRE